MKNAKFVVAGFTAMSLIGSPVSAQVLKNESRFPWGDTPWSSQASVERRMISPVFRSPDGSKFFVISTTANVACDCVINNLLVYRYDDLKTGIANLGHKLDRSKLVYRSIEKTSYRNFAENDYEWLVAGASPFFGARWSADGSSVIYEGALPSGKRQVIAFNLVNDKEEPLTNWPGGIMNAKFLGNSILGSSIIAEPRHVEAYPFEVMSQSSLLDSDVPGLRQANMISYQNGKPWEAKCGDPTYRLFPANSLGKRFVSLCIGKLANDPPKWVEYDNGAWNSASLASGGRPRFVLFDSGSGEERPLFDAPAGHATQLGSKVAAKNLQPRVYWASDGKNLIVVNTALPLSPGVSERQRMAYIVGYNVETRLFQVIEPVSSKDMSGKTSEIVDVKWDQDYGELLIYHSGAGNEKLETRYALRAGKWKSVSRLKYVKKANGTRNNIEDPALATSGVAAYIDEDENNPPMLVAKFQDRKIDLFEKDSALNGRKFLNQNQYTWVGSKGDKYEGGLILPDKLQSNLPLIVQAYSYTPSHFRPDGPNDHADAGQSLAARGFAVLTIDIPLSKGITGPSELSSFSDRLDSAISSLSQAGIVDSSRVGLVGFSRAGYNSFYKITHPGKVAPAAAVIDDAFPGTYSYYLRSGAVNGNGEEGQYGGKFWQNKEEWLKEEPSFNVDKVETPTLFTIHHKSSVNAVRDTIGAFVMNRKPFEWIVYPRAKHGLVWPRERLSSQELTIDWMSFWLLGILPTDKERGARWNAIKLNWELARSGRYGTD